MAAWSAVLRRILRPNLRKKNTAITNRSVYFWCWRGKDISCPIPEVCDILSFPALKFCSSMIFSGEHAPQGSLSKER